jgi:hypothetical protein
VPGLAFLRDSDRLHDHHGKLGGRGCVNKPAVSGVYALTGSTAIHHRKRQAIDFESKPIILFRVSGIGA